MINFSRAIDVLNSCDFPGYAFSIEDRKEFLVLSAIYFERDVTKKPGSNPERQETRKWIISKTWSEDQLVRTAFLCVLTSHEHKVREHFTYRGKPIFGPHFSVDDLVKLCK